MPEQDDIYDPEHVDPDVPNDQRDDYLVRVNRKQIRKLESKAKRSDELEAEVARLTRENAMRDAGVDVSSEKGAFFMKGYDGDLTVDAIKESATKLGVLETPPPAEPESEETTEPPDTPLEDGEADLTGQRQGLAQNAPPGDEVPKQDPYDKADELRSKVMADGGKEQQGLGAAFNSLVNEAHQGNKRVILDRQA